MPADAEEPEEKDKIAVWMCSKCGSKVELTGRQVDEKGWAICSSCAKAHAEAAEIPVLIAILDRIKV